MTRTEKEQIEQALAWSNSPEKRDIDRYLAWPFLCTAGLLGGVALGASRLIDGKGALFRQNRIGQDGQKVEIVKIRTLDNDCDPDAAGSGPDNDQATRFGRVLRSLGIDEIPQVINVLKNDLTVVGPRIINQGTLDLVEANTPKYEFEEWYETYKKFKPGIISSFGIHARKLGRGLKDEEHAASRVGLDNHDFKSFSFGYDAKLLATTGLFVASALARPAIKPVKNFLNSPVEEIAEDVIFSLEAEEAA